MDVRFYFNRKSVLKRLENNNIDISGNKDNDFYVGSGNNSIKGDAVQPKLAYLKLTNFLDLKIPQYLAGLKIIEISLFETLLKEENLHICQGTGREGKSKWLISFADKQFHTVSNASSSWGDGFRSVIQIKIVGSEMQSIKDCYSKIRKGEMDNTWKGESTIPSHCGLPQVKDTAY